MYHIHHDHHGVDMGWHADRALILSRQQPICTAAMTHMCAPLYRHRHDDDDDDEDDDDDDDDDIYDEDDNDDVHDNDDYHD